MQVTLPFIEIILFLTSIFAPAEMSEFDLTTDGRTLHFQQIGENQWAFSHEKMGAFAYTRSGDSITTESKTRLDQRKQAFKMGDFLILPIDDETRSVPLKNGLRMHVSTEDESITYTLSDGERPEATFVVSWGENG